jgi:hypothetical protein
MVPKSTISASGGALPKRDYDMALTLRELKNSRNLLRQAHALVARVSSLFFDAGDPETSARLNDITAHLTDEIGLIERCIEKPAPGETA